MKAVQGFDTEQEKDGRWKCCINTDSISKSGNTSKKLMVKNNLDKPTNYFITGPSCESDKGKVLNQHSKYTKNLRIFLMALGALKAHFLYS